MERESQKIYKKIIFFIIIIGFPSISEVISQIPTIVIFANQREGTAPLEVSFDASQSFSSAGNIQTYLWEFGDGGKAAWKKVRHTFWTKGQYSVSLTIMDDSGASANAIIQISVGQRTGPLAAFSYSIGSESFEIDFDPRYSISELPIKSYSWNFGDSSPEIGIVNREGSPIALMSHTYPRPGFYMVRLKVVDSTGASHICEKGIGVMPNMPININARKIDGTTGGAPSSTDVVRLNLYQVRIFNKKLDLNQDGISSDMEISSIENPTLKKLSWLMITNTADDAAYMSINASGPTVIKPPTEPPQNPRLRNGFESVKETRSLFPSDLFSGIKIDAILFSQKKCNAAPCVAFMQQDPNFSNRDIYVAPCLIPPQNGIGPQIKESLFGVIGGGVDDQVATLDTIDANASRVNPNGFVTLGGGETLFIRYSNCPEIANYFMYFCAIDEGNTKLKINFFEENYPIEMLIDPQYINFPPIVSFEISPEKPIVQENIIFDASATRDPDGKVGYYEWSFGDGVSGTGKTLVHKYVNPGVYEVTLTVIDNMGGSATYKKTVTISAIASIPQEPTSIASSLDLSVETDLFKATQFLYTGNSPMQREMNPNVIDLNRIAVLRGQIKNQDENPISGVKISILNHSEYGWTLSRENGIFDMVVNGGSQLTVLYEKPGYLIVQRQIEVLWKDFAWLPDIVMIQHALVSTTVSLSENSPMQVAQGVQMIDGDGRRLSTLVFPKKTTASLVLSNGNTQTANTLNVRITEYSVGQNGPQKMPAELPPSTGYTYAFEASADEAEALGAYEVRFNQPIIHYVDNFLNFPVGLPVPTGYYDRKKGVWIPSKNGVVVKLLDLNSDNIVDALDSNGDGQPDDLNNDNSYADEVEGLSDPTKYTPNKTIWRVPITHFSPWDCNWPFGPPSDAEAPMQQYNPEPPVDDPCKDAGNSFINIQNQTLIESVPIIGTPFSLNYCSDRVAGYKVSNTLEIPLIAQNIPTSLKRIELEIFIAGQRFTQSFQPSPNLKYNFEWNGRDAYGRLLQGSQSVKFRIGYVYNGVYQTPSQSDQSFGNLSGMPIEGNLTRQEITLWQENNAKLGSFKSEALGFGGWNLDVHHSLVGKTIYMGDGRKLDNKGFGQNITTVAGGGNPLSGLGDGGPAISAKLKWPMSIAVSADGSIYIADAGNSLIRRVDSNGIITTVVGGGSPSDGIGDGGPALLADLAYPTDIAIGHDGSLYIADSFHGRIRKVCPSANGQVVGANGEIITTVAGGGDPPDDLGDGGPATDAELLDPRSVVIGMDDSIYIADRLQHRIRQVGPNGIISSLAGTGEPTGDEMRGTMGDDGPAKNAQLYEPRAIALGNEGSIYIGDGLGIRRIKPNGIITKVTSRDISTWQIEINDGKPAIDTVVLNTQDIEVGTDGNIYISQFGVLLIEINRNFIRKISPDGIITTIAGNGTPCLENYTSDWPNCGDGDLAIKASILPTGIALGPDESIYVACTEKNCIRKIGSVIPALVNNIFINFDSDGRHIETRNALTGVTIYKFVYEKYDGSSLLTNIIDANGNTTKIERDAHGTPLAIISPYNQRTTLSLYADEYLKSITNPANEVTQFTYKNNGPGLLETFADPKTNVYAYEYDSIGRLGKRQDPPAAGGYSTYVRANTTNGYSVLQTTAMGRNSTYQVERLPEGGTRLVNLFSCCNRTEVVEGLDGTRKITSTDGTVTTQQKGADPRFGMSAPMTKNLTIKTPSGLTLTANMNRSVTLSDTNNPLSFSTLSNTIEINGRTYKTIYDASFNKITRTSPEGRQVITTLDAKGRIEGRQVIGLAPISYTYDSRGRLKTMQCWSDENLRSYTLEYDIVPSDDNFVDRIINPEDKTIKFDKYDLTGRLKTLKLPDTNQVLYDYDENGYVKSLTPPGRPAHTFKQTAVNQVEDYVPPTVDTISNIIHYDYNQDRQLDLITRSDGKQIDYIYNANNDHIDKIKILDGTTETGNVTYSYYPLTSQSAGKLLSITRSDNETLIFTYDGFLHKSFKWTGTINGNVEHTHNNDFNVESETINGSNEVRFSYDEDGLLKQAGELILTRDNPLAPETKNGLLRRTTLFNVTTTFEYDEFGELKDYVATFNGTSGLVSNFESHYPIRDKMGRIKEKAEIINGITSTYNYDYDSSERLWKVYKNGILTKEYKYDANGNRYLYNADGSSDVDYDDQDRLHRFGNMTYTYTANGEIETKTDSAGQTKYTYDVFGNLTHVDLPDGKYIDYVIDGKNRRIGIKINGICVQGFLYSDQIKPVAELDGNNNIISRFIYASKPNVPDYMIKGSTTYRIISDHLGSPRIVINAETGAVVQRIDYDEWGNMINTNFGFQPFGFAGGIYDQHTRLTHFGYREYDSLIGRWITKDPLTPFGNVWNSYKYAKNNPLYFIDPLGLRPKATREDFSDEGAMIIVVGPKNSIFDMGIENFATGENNISDTIICNGKDAIDWCQDMPKDDEDEKEDDEDIKEVKRVPFLKRLRYGPKGIWSIILDLFGPSWEELEMREPPHSGQGPRG